MEKDIFNWEKQPKERIIGQTILIPVKNISPDPKNLRETFNQEEIIALGKNIQEIGQMDTIKVFPKVSSDGKWHGEFDLHDGERRWRAAIATGVPYLRAIVEEKPSEEDLIFKRIARVLQTESLKPEEKVKALEKTFDDLGILNKPQKWDKYRNKLGASKERFSELLRVMKLSNTLKELMFSGIMSYTIAQAVGRLPKSRQEDAAKFILSNKLYGRYVVTQFIPYLLEHPEASYAQAFEHTKVGDWRIYTKKPSVAELTSDYEKVIDEFLKSCVQWERAWDKMVPSGILKEIKGKTLSPYRLKDGLRRIIELAEGFLIELYGVDSGVVRLPTTETKQLEHKLSVSGNKTRKRPKS